MKQIYVLALFLFSFAGFSQLYILPDGNNASYVYIEASQFYVDKEIKLGLNPSEEAAASIYLRDEAQLLQGDSGSQNSGNGLISVFQEGLATAYTYNYWGSPVTNNSGSNSFGNIFYEPLNKTNSRKAIITPELNGSANPLKISNMWIYKFSGKNYSDWEYVGSIFNVAPGEGFTMKGVDGTNNNVILYGIANNPGFQQRYDFRGMPNNGTISLPIIKDKTLLVGNPYPSALDLNLFLIENKNCTGIAYFWDSKQVDSHYLSDYEGGYGAYSPAAGNNGYVPAVFTKYDIDNFGKPSGEMGSYYARRFVPIAQGFMLMGEIGGEINFKNNYRKYVPENSDSSEFKLQENETSGNDVAMLRLNIEFDKYTRQLLLVNRDDATTGIDRAKDAKNISNLKTDASWDLENENYLINVRPYDITDVIPLKISIAEKTDVGFTISDVDKFPSEVYLLDSFTHKYHNLKTENFKTTLEAGNYNTRFTICYKDLTILVEEPKPIDHIEGYFIYQNNKEARIEITTPKSSYKKRVEIFDVLGRKLGEYEMDKSENYYEIPTHKFTKGLYIVKILGAEGALVSKKVIISN